MIASAEHAGCRVQSSADTFLGNDLISNVAPQLQITNSYARI